MNFSTTFLLKVAAELRENKVWDNGSPDLGLVTDLCAELRESMGIACHTDGQLITLDA